jgi:hypothetical protein
LNFPQNLKIEFEPIFMNFIKTDEEQFWGSYQYCERGEGQQLDVAGRQVFSMFSDKKDVGVGTMQGSNLNVQTTKC